MAGFNLPTIQRLLGHRDLRMTSRYSHVSANPLQQGMKSPAIALGDAKLTSVKAQVGEAWGCPQSCVTRHLLVPLHPPTRRHFLLTYPNLRPLLRRQHFRFLGQNLERPGLPATVPQ